MTNYYVEVSVYNQRKELVPLNFDSCIAKVNELYKAYQEAEFHFNTMNRLNERNCYKVEYSIYDSNDYNNVINTKTFYLEKDMMLIQRLLEEIEVYTDDLEDFVKRHKSVELTENKLRFNDQESEVWWYSDEETGKQGFIDYHTCKIYTPNWNRIEFLEAMINFLGLSDELIESLKITDDEVKEIKEKNDWE